MRLERANGEYRWFLIRIAPVLDQQGNLIKRYGVAIDIEERKRAEEKLKQSESQLAEAQRLAHVGSWDYDLRTNKVTWSDELYRIFGLQPGTIEIAGDAMPFIHPDDRDLVFRTVANAIKNRESYSFYHRGLRSDGDERIVHSRGFIVSDENGDPIKVVGASQDVTELKRAEEKLKATSEQLRALSARLQSAREEEGTRIARELHDELGSALTSLRWGLDEIDSTLSKNATKGDANTMHRKIAALTTLVEGTVHTVRRISSELRPSILDDIGLVATLEWEIQKFERRTGITCHFDSFDRDVHLTREQSTAVFRIFQEALTNVIRHAGATTVEIRVKEKKGEFVLQIEDNGKGMTESDISGTESLGLLGMRERAHLIGGEVRITSAEGGGTAVAVHLPIAG
jgi:PAS domain S-box-containing protein